jgi:AcrR family transcriptional regulator
MSIRTAAARRASRRSADAPRLGRGRRPQSRKLRDARDALYREHIMEVAERIFAETGFAATRMQDIAAAAGISLATLYQSYPGKEQLHRSLLIARDREMLERVEASAHARVPQSVEQVLLLMETHLAFLLEHPDYLRMQLKEGYAWYHRAAQPTAEERQMWERGLKNIEAVLDWGVGRRLFSAGNAVDQARMMMAMQQTRFANWVMEGMREPHAAVIGHIQADFVRLCCRPAIAAKLLSDDGSGLNPKTQERIRMLGAQT